MCCTCATRAHLLEHHIIKAYRSEVLTKETITDGRIVRDKYK